MVKVGFICEGFTEFILIQSPVFKEFLTEYNITLVNVINAQGAANLLPHNITAYIGLLEKAGAEKIIILTDLDADVCITKTKERIAARAEDIVIIAVKQIEAWFLACTSTMRLLLNNAVFTFEYPEEEENPFEKIHTLLIEHTGRGTGPKGAGKIKLVKRLLDLGLDLSQAAAHKACPSARYFIEKMKSLS
jgi:hypothetical protein